MPEFVVSLLTILLTAAVAVPIAILSMFLVGLLRLEAARGRTAARGARSPGGRTGHSASCQPYRLTQDTPLPCGTLEADT